MNQTYNALLDTFLSQLHEFRQKTKGITPAVVRKVQELETTINASYMKKDPQIDTACSSDNSRIEIEKAHAISNNHEPGSPESDIPFDVFGWLNSELDVRYAIDKDLVQLQPNPDQWSNFPTILQCVTNLGADKIGVFKVAVPGVGPLAMNSSHNIPAFAYNTQKLSNGTIRIEMAPGEFASPSDSAKEPASTMEAVKLFEQLIGTESGLEGTRYRTDVDVRTNQERNRLGLPASPIWPLAGDGLTKTRARIPGIHWPYAYNSNAAFGAVFAMHREDWDLFSVNYLYEGTKIWIIIPPSFTDLFEKSIRMTSERRKLSNCSQFLRHNPIYVLTTTLDSMGVKYKIVRQNAGEALVTFPRVYHQGFSVGRTLAEAVNYANDDWNIENYKECDGRVCPKEFISRQMIECPIVGEETPSATEIREEQEQQQQHQHQQEEEGGRGEEEEEEKEEGFNDNDEKRSDQDEDDTQHGSTKKINSAATQNYSGKNRKSTRSIRPKLNAAKSDNTDRKLKVTLKRKGDNSGITSQKSAKIDRVSRQAVTSVFNGVLSDHMVGPWDVYNEFVQLSSEMEGGFDDSRALLLTKLFFAIGSPDAFCQLRDACIAIREGNFQLYEPTEGFNQTIKALDNLETTFHLTSISRRYYLSSLSAARFRLQDGYSQVPRRASARGLKRSENDKVYGRVGSQALAAIMADAYPDLEPTRRRNTRGLDEYGRKMDLLKKRLAAGQKWSKLAEAFAPGMLALVPTQGDYQLSNSEYEKLSADAISALIQILTKYRGDFLTKVSMSVSSFTTEFLRQGGSRQMFLFERAEPKELKREQQDSLQLIELCKFDRVDVTMATE